MDRVNLAPASSPTGWQLDAEGVAVKIRWVGLVIGYLYANLSTAADPLPLNLILTVGFGFTVLATYYSLRRRVFLGSYPLLISCMEALFIGLLCYFDRGTDSPFRFYYLLSLICAAIRYSPAITGITCALDALSFGILYLSLPVDQRDPAALAGMWILLAWVTWAAAALARLLHRIGEQLEQNQTLLEERIAERTRELQESQAQVLHQEKMAAFGLLAAGIAHEVGNPLTSISTLIQLLERRDLDDYTRERLGLVNTQLTRIQAILRELVTFGRPASDTRGRVSLLEIVDEALGIAKYYKGVKSREVRAEIRDDLPGFIGVRDQLVQVFLNLILNAIDATGKGGKVLIEAHVADRELIATVTDDGPGIATENRDRLFRPYFTTKRHGTGLGLFVTRKLVLAHGGTVSFDSPPGGGTTFRLVFPLAASSGAVVPQPAAG